MMTGNIKANYFLDSVTLQIKDAEGNVVMDHRMFATVSHYYDFNSNDNGIRNYNDSYDLAGFSAPLQYVQFENGQTYSYSITAHLATGDDIPLKDGSFVQGQA